MPLLPLRPCDRQAAVPAGMGDLALAVVICGVPWHGRGGVGVAKSEVEVEGYHIFRTSPIGTPRMFKNVFNWYH